MTHPSRPDDDFPDAEVTQVMRTRLLPRDWDPVHKGHEAKAQVQISVAATDKTWEATFDLKALGNTGCLVSTKLARCLCPFPLQNQCQVIVLIPNEPPVVINARIDHPDIRKKGAVALKISFRDLSEEDQAKLSAYRDFLRNPPPVANEITYVMPRPGQFVAAIRRGLPLALGLALAALSSDTPPNTPSTTPQSNIPTASAPGGIETVQAHCRIRFADGAYFPKCGDTLNERRSTKLEFLPKDEQPTQEKGLTLKADLRFERGGKSCETVTPVKLIKGETAEGSVHFTCDESPQ